MTKKEQFDAYLQIAQFTMARADFRRQLEWKFAFGIWALLGLTIFSVKADQFPIWIGPAVLFLYAMWLQALLNRNVNDSKLAWEALKKGDALLKLSLPLDTPPHLKPLFDHPRYQQKFGFLTNWSLALEFLFTTGLVLIFYQAKVKEYTWLKLSISLSSQCGS